MVFTVSRAEACGVSVSRSLIWGLAVALSLSLSGGLALAETEWAAPEKVAAVMAGEVAVADASWWGFAAEESTTFLQAAFDSPATTVRIPAQATPWVVEPLQIKRDNLTVEFDEGAVLEAKKGAFKGRNEVMLRIWNCNNIRLRGYGAAMRMHKRDYWQPPYARSGWRHIVDIRGSNGVEIEGLTLANSGGDGIYISSTSEQSHSKDIVVRNVICDENNRQGMSVISVENLLVERSLFNNTIGAAPMAGIDLEPNNATQRLVNVVIRDSIFTGNSQLGMHVWLRYLRNTTEPVSVEFCNNYIRGGEIGIHVANVRDDGPSGLIRIHDNVVEGTHHAGILMRQFSARSGMKVEYARNRLINTARRGPYDEATIDYYRTRSKLESPALWWRPKVPSAPIVLTAQNPEPTLQGGISFDNDLVVHDRNEPIVLIGGPWGEHKERFDGNKEEAGVKQFEGWQGVSGKINVINPYGARIEQQGGGEAVTLKLEPAE